MSTRESNCPFSFWTLEDGITTVVEANGCSVWRISADDGSIEVELNETLSDETACLMSGQFPLAADYSGNGAKGAIFTLHQA